MGKLEPKMRGSCASLQVKDNGQGQRRTGQRTQGSRRGKEEQTRLLLNQWNCMVEDGEERPIGHLRCPFRVTGRHGMRPSPYLLSASSPAFAAFHLPSIS